MGIKRALITGINGQDASYLAELLLEKGYEIFGVKRRASVDRNERIASSLHNPNLHILEGDVTDFTSMSNIIATLQPDEIYNTAAQSHVHTSFEQPFYTFNVNTLGVLNILEAIKLNSKNSKLIQSSTSEMFGKNFDIDPNGKKVQDEKTQFSPNSPYAVAKVAAHELVRLYRESYGLFACSAIMHNHESPRRGENFVTRKITKWLGKFLHWAKEYHNFAFDDKELIRGNGYDDRNESYSGTFPKLRLGNLAAYRDWGHSKDYMDACWTILQQDKPDDFMICTGETHSVEDFLIEAFKVGSEIKDGCLLTNWKDYIYIDPKFYRPCEVDYLCGDNTKIVKTTNWKPTTNFSELVKEMVLADYEAAY
jgi:GDPmannose 4,6-dehydratase